MWWRQTSPSVDAARATLDAGEVEPAPSEELVLEPAQAEPVRESVAEEVKTPEVVPEEAMTPQETVFDEEDFWAATLDRKMEKFLEDPGDLGNADKLLTRSIMALLSLEGRYTEELEGVPTPAQRGSEDETWISSSGPFGNRMFTVSRFEFPEHFEILEAYQEGPEEFLAPQRIDEDLCGRILFTANRVRERFPKRE